jgi:hypothetical protein
MDRTISTSVPPTFETSLPTGEQALRPWRTAWVVIRTPHEGGRVAAGQQAHEALACLATAMAELGGALSLRFMPDK